MCIRDRVKLIKRYNQKYYSDNISEITDSEYDSLKSKILKNNRGYKIHNEGKKIFFENLSKIGYSRKVPQNIKKNRYKTLLIKAFQRRYRPELINGKIDQECLLISQNLI